MTSTKGRLASQSEDLFFDALVQRHVGGNERFVRRDWLAARVDGKLAEPGARFVLLTAEPGAGKSVFMAQLAHGHPDWPRYFIRRDQRSVLADVSEKSLLLRIGYQLAARHPELFSLEQLRLSVVQRLGEVVETGEVVGAEVQRLIASPFYQTVLEIEQQVRTNRGSVAGLRIEELVVEPRLLPAEDLLHLALIHPARALQRIDSRRRIVILIDALDEIRHHATAENIVAWLTSCPDDLPQNLRFVLTSRPTDESLALFCARQGSRVARLTIAEDDPNVQREVEQFVARLVEEPGLAAALAQTEDGAGAFVERVIAKANGNLGYLDALARGTDRALIDEDARTLEALLRLEELPADLEGLYAFFLHQIKASVARERIELEDADTGETYDKPIWPAFYDRVLGVLAVAMDALDVELIARLGAIRAERAWIIYAIGRLLQFVDVRGKRYRLYHATLAEFLTAHSTAASADTADLYQDAMRRHRQIADLYWRQREDWTTCDDYGLDNLAAHLSAIGDVGRLSGLLNETWLRARAAQHARIDGSASYAPFLDDVRLIAQCARSVDAAESARDRPAPHLGTELLCALCQASVNGLSSQVHPPLLAALVDKGVWSTERALASARSTPDLRQRVDGLAALAASLDGPARTDTIEEALRTIGLIDDDASRAHALRQVLGLVAPAQLTIAVAIARSCRHLEPRIRALLDTAAVATGAARQEILDEALADVPRLNYTYDRARAFKGIAALCRADRMHELLVAAGNLPSADDQADALSEIFPRLPEGLRERELDGVLTSVKAATDPPARAAALARLIPHLGQPLREEVLQQAFAAARERGSDKGRARAWSALSRYLPEAQQNELFEATLAALIEGDEHASALLASLAPMFPQERLVTLLMERAPGDDPSLASFTDTAMAFTRLVATVAHRLGPTQRAEMAKRVLAVGAKLQEAETGSMYPRFYVPGYLASLRSLAPCVPHECRAQLFDTVLATALQCESIAETARHLAQFARFLDAAQLERVEALIGSRMGDEAEVVTALTSLAPYLSDRRIEQVFETVSGLADAGMRAARLKALAAYLPERLHRRALAAVRRLGPWNEDARAQILAAVAPRLEDSLLVEVVKTLRRLPLASKARFEGLAGIAGHLSGRHGDRLLALALAGLQRMDRTDRVYLLQARLSSAPAPLKPRLAGAWLRTVADIRDPYWRADALAKGAAQLPETLLEEAATVARSCTYRSSWALCALAARARAGGREALLAEAFHTAPTLDRGEGSKVLLELLAGVPGSLAQPAEAAVRDFQFADAGQHALALALVAGAWPGPRRGELLAQACALARASENARERLGRAAQVFRYLPDDSKALLIGELVDDIATIEGDFSPVDALVELPGHAPEGHQEALVAALLDCTSRLGESAAARLLVGLIPQLSVGQLVEALEARPSMQDRRHRVEILSAIATAHGSCKTLYPLWRRLSPELAEGTRVDFLAAVGALAPLIATLGGERAVDRLSEGIADAQIWWPS
jgi:hypothetical protein